MSSVDSISPPSSVNTYTACIDSLSPASVRNLLKSLCTIILQRGLIERNGERANQPFPICPGAIGIDCSRYHLLCHPRVIVIKEMGRAMPNRLLVGLPHTSIFL